MQKYRFRCGLHSRELNYSLAEIHRNATGFIAALTRLRNGALRKYSTFARSTFAQALRSA